MDASRASIVVCKKISLSLFESHSVQFSSAFSVLCPHTEHCSAASTSAAYRYHRQSAGQARPLIGRTFLHGAALQFALALDLCASSPLPLPSFPVFLPSAVFKHISLCSVLQCSSFPFLSFPQCSDLKLTTAATTTNSPPTHADNLTITSSSKASPTSTFWTCYKFGQIKLLTPLLLLPRLLLLTCTSTTTEIYLQSGFVFSQCVLAQFVVGGSRDHRGTVHFKKAYSTSASSTSYSSFLSSSSSSGHHHLAISSTSV